MKNPTDFSKYQTYSFLGWQNNSGELLSVKDKAIMRDAFVKELPCRGITTMLGRVLEDTTTTLEA